MDGIGLLPKFKMKRVVMKVMVRWLRSGHLGTRPEESFAPLAADGLEAANDVPALLAGLTTLEPAVPLTALDPARTLFAAFFLAPEVRNEFTGRSKAARCRCC